LIEIQDLCLRQGKFSLDNINFKIEEGQYAVLMGQTGCGKTSILESIAGLRPVHSGAIKLHGLDVTNLRPACRGIGFVPQEGSLFSSMSVKDNLAFALSIRKWKRVDLDARVKELSELLGIGHLLSRSIKGLSGGERQRIALGRALAFRPSVLLLDEPLSAVDENTRESLCDLLKRVQEETGVTALHVTHSQWEATRLGDVRIELDQHGVLR
jgi:molybdate/tungstate transport system ATP-binding protein